MSPKHPKRAGNSGRYFIARNWLFEEELSSLTWGQLRLRCGAAGGDRPTRRLCDRHRHFLQHAGYRGAAPKPFAILGDIGDRLERWLQGPEPTMSPRWCSQGSARDVGPEEGAGLVWLLPRNRAHQVRRRQSPVDRHGAHLAPPKPPVVAQPDLPVPPQVQHQDTEHRGQVLLAGARSAPPARGGSGSSWPGTHALDTGEFVGDGLALPHRKLHGPGVVPGPPG